MRLRSQSQKGLILQYMKDHANKIIDPADFVSPWTFSSVPFIGYSASARLVELKNYGLVEVVGTIEPKITFLRKSAPRNAYAITEKGLSFNLS